MPTYQHGNIWTTNPSVLVFPANGMINNRGALVMGAGFALQVRTKYPGIDLKLGNKIKAYPLKRDHRQFFFVETEGVGAFQTKLDWRDSSPLWLIEASVKAFHSWLTKHPDQEVHMTMPGCGLGGLPPHQVKPLLASLPERVHIWTY